MLLALLIADPVLDFLITVLGGAVATLLGITVTYFANAHSSSTPVHSARNMRREN